MIHFIPWTRRTVWFCTDLFLVVLSSIDNQMIDPNQCSPLPFLSLSFYSPTLPSHMHIDEMNIQGFPLILFFLHAFQSCQWKTRGRELVQTRETSELMMMMMKINVLSTWFAQQQTTKRRAQTSNRINDTRHLQSDWHPASLDRTRFSSRFFLPRSISRKKNDFFLLCEHSPGMAKDKVYLEMENVEVLWRYIDKAVFHGDARNENHFSLMDELGDL